MVDDDATAATDIIFHLELDSDGVMASVTVVMDRNPELNAAMLTQSSRPGLPARVATGLYPSPCAFLVVH